MKHFDLTNTNDVLLFDDLCATVYRKLQTTAQKGKKAFGDFFITLGNAEMDDELKQALELKEGDALEVNINLSYEIDAYEDKTYYASVDCEQLDEDEEYEMCGFVADVVGDCWEDELEF